MDPSLHRKNEQLQTAMAWNEENHERAMQILTNILKERRRIAKMAIKADHPDTKKQWMDIFDYLNNDIKKLLGL